LIAVWATGPNARTVAELAVARGLGRYASGIARVFDDPEPFARCSGAIASGEATVAVAAVIDQSIGTRAMAFGGST
jgi:hypothetical protein